MFSPSLLLQPPSGSLLPFLEPMHTLCLSAEAILAWAEQDRIETMKQATKTMEHLEEFHRLLLKDLTMANQDHGGTPDTSLQGSTQKEKKEGTFALTMAIPGFSAEELTLKLVGRKLLLLGSKESKRRGDDGSISYKNELIRRESDLPAALNLKELACFLSSNGQLCVEGPLQEPPARIERDVPIQLSKQLSHRSERTVPIQLSKVVSPGIERNVPIQRSTATTTSTRSEEQSEEDGSKDSSKTDGQGGMATA
ncbi:heat shock protein 30C-like [Pleurodeles waltl]|uniref:heat shock protein 30C-like n=1 Tax=Pleurodeles waltl TaxID=8319 RepID=UPI0037097CD1